MRILLAVLLLATACGGQMECNDQGACIDGYWHVCDAHGNWARHLICNGNECVMETCARHYGP